jgi:glycosyltransferase involved in cell wall biosynthesis
MTSPTARPLGIFVSYASGCLTDHEPHGDGLICFSLLNGLARRGHDVFAYAPHAAIQNADPRLRVRVREHRSPADSLAGWEHLWRAGRWLRELLRTERVDLTWRMHPYGEGCPGKPPTDGRPLVIGPLFRGWPADTPVPAGLGQPRFGIGIGKYVRPLARRGWEGAMRAASLILCATPGHVREVQAAYPRARVLLTPVTVDPPPEDRPRVRWTGEGPFRLLFVANLYPGKNARVFCELVGELRHRGVNAHGTLIGDGAEWAVVQELIAARGLGDHVRMLGKIPNAEVFGHLRASHLLVSTSIGEPYGRGIAEAMAIGTPTACHRSGGPAEFITNGADGLLISELTAAAYADEICPVAADPIRWDALAAGAARTAADWRSEVVLGTLEQALYGLCRGTTVR